MAKKNVEKDGKMREQLKSALPEPGETVISRARAEGMREELKKINDTPPQDSAQSTFVAATDPVTSKGGVKVTPATISKPEAELLARKFNDKPKETTLPLDALVDEVKAKNIELQKMKAGRVKTSSRTVAMLRSTDPKGKRTCSFCGQRVLIVNMCSKKELCEVCAS